MPIPQVKLDLMEFIERNILPKYTEFGPSHGLKHVMRVIANTLELVRITGVDANMAYTVAAYHDLGMSGPRAIHHITGGKILAADARLKRWFTPEQIKLMREAVEDHRASQHIRENRGRSRPRSRRRRSFPPRRGVRHRAVPRKNGRRAVATLPQPHEREIRRKRIHQTVAPQLAQRKETTATAPNHCRRKETAHRIQQTIQPANINHPENKQTNRRTAHRVAVRRFAVSAPSVKIPGFMPSEFLKEQFQVFLCRQNF